MRLYGFLAILFLTPAIAHAESVFIWPDLAPGENSQETGTLLPFRKSEIPPVSRVTKIRRPSLDVFRPDSSNGTAIVVLPGGGFGKVVPDKEGSEVAPWLNRLGITVFVLRYRTNEVIPPGEPAWKRPLQDIQRSLRYVRGNAEKFNIDESRVGVMGFSAGGQVAAILHGDIDPAYQPIDHLDDLSCRPDFSLLIYPWRVYDEQSGSLISPIRITANAKPAFIVHTHDDSSTSLGSVAIYSQLKKLNVPAELHIYENGGHGYGTRSVDKSNIGRWPSVASDWLIRRRLGSLPE